MSEEPDEEREREAAEQDGPAYEDLPRASGEARTVAESRSEVVQRIGRTAWALLGILVLIAATAWAASRVMLVVVPVVLALFPATLLVPVSRWLQQRKVPAALAALLSILTGLAGLGLLIGLMVPLVIAELPQLADSATAGLAEFEGFLSDNPFGIEIGGFSGLLEMAQEQLGEAGDVAGPAVDAAIKAFEFVAGILLMLVVLFFYLKDGTRLSEGAISLFPSHQQPRLRGIADRAWDTLASYFRGQLLVALVDAVAIGVGLVILGIPLALPLSVLIFFGGLFPIVGAVSTGALAVLVALADQGLVSALIVLAIVVAVQQLEGNVLEPLILGRAIHLHPLLILASITAGGVVLGILGAFLAVPLAAIIARVVAYVRADEDELAAGGVHPDDT